MHKHRNDDGPCPYPRWSAKCCGLASGWCGAPAIGGPWNLENLLSECGRDQLDCEVCCSVVLVNDRVDLDHLQAEHASVVGDDFHRQVRFAVSRAAPYRSTDPWSIFRVYPVHVQRDVI